MKRSRRKVQSDQLLAALREIKDPATAFLGTEVGATTAVLALSYRYREWWLTVLRSAGEGAYEVAKGVYTAAAETAQESIIDPLIDPFVRLIDKTPLELLDLGYSEDFIRKILSIPSKIPLPGVPLPELPGLPSFPKIKIPW